MIQTNFLAMLGPISHRVSLQNHEKNSINWKNLLYGYSKPLDMDFEEFCSFALLMTFYLNPFLWAVPSNV